MTRHRLLAQNTMANFGGRLGAILLSLVVSTLLFHELGSVRYGAWSLLVAIAGYSMLFDFGLGASVERRVAALSVARDERGISLTISTALTLLAIVLGAIQVVIWIGLTLRTAPIEPGFLEQGLAVLPACMAMTASGLAVGAGLSGLQRMALLQRWRILGLAAGSAAVSVLTVAGVRRMDVLLATYCAGGAISAVGAWMSLRSLLPGLALQPGVDRRTAHELVRFGGVLQIATMAPTVGEYVIRVAIGTRFGLGLAGIYDLAGRAAIVLRSLAGALFSAMVPFGVHTLAEGDPAGAERLIAMTVKYTALLVLPASALFWSQAGQVSAIWIGQGGSADALAVGLRILLVAHAVASLGVPMAMLGRSAGRPLPEAIVTSGAFALAAIAALIVSSWPVVFGLGWGLSALGGLVLWWWLGRMLRVRFVSGRDLTAIALLAVLCFAAAEAGARGVVLLGIASHVVQLLAASAAALTAFAMGVTWSGILDPAERERLQRVFT